MNPYQKLKTELISLLQVMVENVPGKPSPDKIYSVVLFADSDEVMVRTAGGERYEISIGKYVKWDDVP